MTNEKFERIRKYESDCQKMIWDSMFPKLSGNLTIKDVVKELEDDENEYPYEYDDKDKNDDEYPYE